MQTELYRSCFWNELPSWTFSHLRGQFIQPECQHAQYSSPFVLSRFVSREESDIQLFQLKRGFLTIVFDDTPHRILCGFQVWSIFHIGLLKIFLCLPSLILFCNPKVDPWVLPYRKTSVYSVKVCKCRSLAWRNVMSPHVGRPWMLSVRSFSSALADKK